MRILGLMVLSCLITLTAAIGSACGPMPSPLRDLVKYSDLVVVANVDEIVLIETSEEHHNHKKKATLTIQRVLGGQSYGPSVDVLFYTSAYPVSTLAAPRYRKGETVLAFLYYPPGQTEYQTFDSAYGAMAVLEEKPSWANTEVITPDELEYLELRIAEIQNILQIKDDDLRMQSTLDWLVDCAADPKTRWVDSIYELGGRHGFCSGYERDCDFVKYPSMMTDQHRAILFAALQANEGLGSRSLSLARLIKNSHAEQVADLLLDRLDPEQTNSGAFRVMELIAELKDDSYLVTLANDQHDFAKIEEWKNSGEYRQQIINHFVESARSVE